MVRETLTVPITTEAWVVNEAVLTADSDHPFRNIRRWKLQYSNLNNFGSPMPDAFTKEAKLAGPQDLGVYLYWTLPKALRHQNTKPKQPASFDSKAQDAKTRDSKTTPSDDSKVSFPALPNRWLITRTNGSKSISAWVVESDFLGDPQGSAYPSPYYLPNSGQSGQSTQTTIGRCIPLQDWLKAKPDLKRYLPKEQPLTAVSSGDLHFLAYQAYNKNVFSFHDRLGDDMPKQTFSYSVLGWYADPQQDPLSQSEGQASFAQWLLSTYQWQAGSLPDGQRVICSLYHGRINGVIWDPENPDPPEPKGIPAKYDLTVAIGSSPSEALQALVNKKGPSIIPPKLLSALQHGLMDKWEESDALEDMAQHAHQSEFGAQAGGITWTLVPPPPPILPLPGMSLPAPEAKKVAAVVDMLAQAQPSLDDLNLQQADLENQQRILEGMQWQLYALWWKQGNIEKNYLSGSVIPDSGELSRAIGQLQQQILTQTDVCNQQLQKVQDAYNQLTKIVPLGALKKHLRQPFSHPEDPVLLVTGIYQPPFQDPKASLPCRYNDECIVGIKIDKSTTLTAEQAQPYLPGLDVSKLPYPDSIQRLLMEGYLLDPGNAESLKPLVTPAQLKTLIDIMQQHPPANFLGTLPLYGLDPWEQPWSPLFVEWSVQWFPLPFKHWVFNNHIVLTERALPLSFYYQLADLPDPMPIAQTLSGHSMLTPQASFAFKGQLKRLFQQYPDLQQQFPNWRELLEEIDNWKILSLTLRGFHQLLAQRYPNLSRKPHPDDSKEKPFADLMGNQSRGAPLPGTIPASPSSLPLSAFQTLRAGQFYFNGLSVVDRFGQAIDVIACQQKTPDLSFVPLISETLTPNIVVKLDPGPQPKGWIQLTPRIIQSNRLEMDWMAPEDSQQRILFSSDTNPIAGWILPNYLDQALQVFNPDGQCLGQLQKNPLTWQSQDLRYTNLTLLKGDYPILGGMLLALTVTAYEELLEACDQAFAGKVSVSPYAHYLAAVIGRPMALVRAGWQLELQHSAYQDQSWASTLSPPLNPYPEFSILLGNADLNKDGLIGYFMPDAKCEDDFTVLYSPYQSKGGKYVHSQFITDFMSGVKKTVMQLTPQNPPEKPQKGIFSTAILLMDPLAAVHAYTDILPVQSLKLPDHFVKAGINKLSVTFQQGPLLTQRFPAAASKIPQSPAGDLPLLGSMRFLQPSLKGEWSWCDPKCMDDKGYITWNGKFSLQPTDNMARFDFAMQPVEIVEGRLRLSQIGKQAAAARLTQDSKAVSSRRRASPHLFASSSSVAEKRSVLQPSLEHQVDALGALSLSQPDAKTSGRLIRQPHHSFFAAKTPAMDQLPAEQESARRKSTPAGYLAYLTRQDLYNLTLVSKRSREIAEPLLTTLKSLTR